MVENAYKKYTSDVFIIGITTILQFLLGFVQLPLLSKYLGTHDYGIWAQANVTISLILSFSGLGLGAALIRFLATEKNRAHIKDQFYSVIFLTFIANFVVTMVIFAAARPLAEHFFDGAVQVVVLAAFIALLSSINGTYLNMVRTFQQIKAYSLFTIVEEVIRIGLIAYLILTGHGIISVLYSVLVTKFIMLLWLYLYMASRIGVKLPRPVMTRKYFRFSLPLVPAGLAFWLLLVSDRYVIAYYLGVTSVGVYSAASTLGSMFYALVGVLNLVLMQTLSKLYDEARMQEVSTLLVYSLKYFMAIAIPYIFGAAVLARPILRMFSTPEIAVQGRLATPIIAVGTLFLSVTMIVAYNLILTKKTKIIAYTWIGVAALNLGLNVFLVPVWGINAAALTTLTSFVIAFGVIRHYAFKEFKFSFGWPFIFKSLVASSLMSVVVGLMAPHGFLDTFLTVTVGVVVYGIAITLMRGFTRSEIAFFRSIIRRNAPA